MYSCIFFTPLLSNFEDVTPIAGQAIFLWGGSKNFSDWEGPLLNKGLDGEDGEDLHLKNFSGLCPLGRKNFLLFIYF